MSVVQREKLSSPNVTLLTSHVSPIKCPASQIRHSSNTPPVKYTTNRIHHESNTPLIEYTTNQRHYQSNTPPIEKPTRRVRHQAHASTVAYTTNLMYSRPRMLLAGICSCNRTMLFSAWLSTARRAFAPVFCHSPNTGPEQKPGAPSGA